MAIEPIKGFYVHDEVTDTDGVAKVSIDAVHEFVEDVSGTVENWLGEHPEATTTVQDGSVTTAKLATGAVTSEKVGVDFLKTIKNAYVTPEMFGAKGDGETDDTTAIQAAIDSGKSVYCGNVYKITSPLRMANNFTLFGNSAFSSSKSKITAVGCDVVHIEAGTRFACLHDIRLASDCGGIVFTGSGTVTRCVFSRLTLACKYDITDTFVNDAQVTSGVTLWNCTFDNISSYVGDTSDKYALYLFAPARSFAITFVNFVTGNKSVNLNAISASFTGSNFGFDLVTKFTTGAGAYLDFVDCNFEDDVVGTATKMDLGSARLHFSTCTFQTRADNTDTPWFKFKSSVISTVFENCEFKVNNNNNNFWHPEGNAITYPGGLKFIGPGQGPYYTSNYQKGTVNNSVGNAITVYADNQEHIIRYQFGLYKGQMAYYDGTKWRRAGSLASYSAPADPSDGQLWTNGNDLKTYVWYGDAWFDMMGNRYTPT